MQRGYTLQQMENLAEQAGMNIVKVLDGDTGQEVNEESERIIMVLKAD